MEIDIKAEQKKVQEKIQQLLAEGNQLGDKIDQLKQQRQKIINQIVGEKRLLDYFKELKTK